MTIDELHRPIRDTIPTLDGWCSPERAINLADLVIKSKARDSVCLGVWGGRDTFAMAMAHRFCGKGKCVAVDPFQAGASVQGQQAEADREWWGSQERHDVVLNRFLGNSARLGLDPWISFQRTTSRDAVPPKQIGVLVVDGNHGPDSIADVEKWAPLVVRNGYAYMDDLNWTGGAVLKAVERLMSFGFEKLFERDTGAFFQRVSLPAPTPDVLDTRRCAGSAVAARNGKRAKR